MKHTNEKLERLKSLDREALRLGEAGEILRWDQETYMPEEAIEARSEQVALLESLAHERESAEEVGRLLEELGSTTETPLGDASLPAGERAFLRAKRRSYDLSTKLPSDLVRRFAEVTSRAQAAWVKAKGADDFEEFRPHLEEILRLSQEKAERFGYQEQIYDALLDQFEPFMKTSEVEALFSGLRSSLVGLVEAIRERPQIDDSMLRHSFPVERQETLGYELLNQLGYQFNRGRLDVSAHPFTTTLGPHDVRITTRYHEDLFASALFSTIHEAGHALYELGVAGEYHNTLLARGSSLGIHESQSRLWENMIGRSRQFWSHWFPRLTELFPRQLSGVEPEAFYRAINRVEPSLIRIEADEVTYSLHVILRFQLEVELMRGELEVKDLPEAWNATMEKLLGVIPPTNALGVLQDVHWSMGAIGYFPTYALGNLYAAQFLHTLTGEIPEVWEQVEQGNLSSVLHWLREKIHRHGSAKSPAELIREVTGSALDPSHFVRYLQSKYGELYGLS
ncbi:MAG: carboxypeptidase M32 [Alkalispirochaetaceae bacterium]